METLKNNQVLKLPESCKLQKQECRAFKKMFVVDNGGPWGQKGTTALVSLPWVLHWQTPLTLYSEKSTDLFSKAFLALGDKSFKWYLN